MIRKVYILLFTAFAIVFPAWPQVQSHIDSLEKLLETASPEERVQLFCQISELYWQRSYDTSLLMAIHANNIAGELDDPALMATSLYMIGNAHYLLGDFPTSMDYYLQALGLREELGDSNTIAGSYNNIGAVYLKMHDDRQALEYFKKAGELFRALGDEHQLFFILNNIGAVYMESEILDTAFQYFQNAYEIADHTGNEVNQSVSLANMGETALAMGLYSRSEEYQRKAYEISHKLGDKGMMATIQSNLGRLYLKTGKMPEALQAFQESLILAKDIHSATIVQDNYKNLSEFYSLSGDQEKALHFYRLYDLIKDSILSQEGLMKIKELELKSNARSLEQEIQLLRMENEIQSLKQTRLKYGIASLTVITLALILVFIIYHQRNRFKRETTRILGEKNLLLEKANRKLQESEKHLKELNSTKNKFFSIIGHDLRNPLNALLGFSELISGNSREYSSEEIQKYSQIINDAAKNIHMLIENLLEWSRSQSGSIEFNPRSSDLYPLVEGIIRIFQIQAEKKDITINMEIAKEMKIYADLNLLSTIIRNLVSNAVKFTTKKGRVLVSAEDTNEGVSVSVKDTGTGMTGEQLDTIFSLVHEPSTPGTAEEKGTGLGLILCKEFVDKHGGRIWAESEPGKGSTFTIIFPNKEQNPS